MCGDTSALQRLEGCMSLPTPSLGTASHGERIVKKPSREYTHSYYFYCILLYTLTNMDYFCTMSKQRLWLLLETWWLRLRSCLSGVTSGQQWNTSLSCWRQKASSTIVSTQAGWTDLSQRRCRYVEIMQLLPMDVLNCNDRLFNV